MLLNATPRYQDAQLLHTEVGPTSIDWRFGRIYRVTTQAGSGPVIYNSLEAPYGHVILHCPVCKADFDVRILPLEQRQELRREDIDYTWTALLLGLIIFGFAIYTGVNHEGDWARLLTVLLIIVSVFSVGKAASLRAREPRRIDIVDPRNQLPRDGGGSPQHHVKFS